MSGAPKMSSSGPASTDAPCIHCRLADQSMTWPRALLIARGGSPHTDLGLYRDDILRLRAGLTGSRWTWRYELHEDRNLCLCALSAVLVPMTCPTSLLYYVTI